MNLFVNYTLGSDPTNKPLQTKTKCWQCSVFQWLEGRCRGDASGRDQWQYGGLWWEFGLRGSARFWGKKLGKSEAAHRTGVGASLTCQGGWLLLLWGFTIRGWHKHRPHSQDTGTPAAMWVKAEDHLQTTVFPPPPHLPSPPPRICNHFPKPSHLLSSSHCLFFPPLGLNNTIHPSPSIHSLHMCTCLDPTSFLCWQHVPVRWKGRRGINLLQHFLFISLPRATATMKSRLIYSTLSPL